MSGINLDAIQARANAATEGPWWTTSALRPPSVFSGGGSASDVGVLEAFEPADAAFIAAGSDVPVLVEVVRDVLAVVAEHPACKDTKYGCHCHYINPDEIRAAITAHIDLTDPEGELT